MTSLSSLDIFQLMMELRENLLRWFATLVAGSPSLEQLSTEQRANVEALADATEQWAKEKFLYLSAILLFFSRTSIPTASGCCPTRQKPSKIKSIFAWAFSTFPAV